MFNLDSKSNHTNVGIQTIFYAFFFSISSQIIFWRWLSQFSIKFLIYFEWIFHFYHIFVCDFITVCKSNVFQKCHSKLSNTNAYKKKRHIFTSVILNHDNNQMKIKLNAVNFTGLSHKSCLVNIRLYKKKS